MNIGIGVDGALEHTGIAVKNLDTNEVLYLGKIRTVKKKATPTESKRLEQIFRELNILFGQFKPSVLVLENQHVNRRNPQTSMTLARVRGVVQLTASLAGIQLVTLEPSEVKKTVTGKGNADKKLVQESLVSLYADSDIVQSKLGTFIESGVNKTDDMADALGLLHTYERIPGSAVSA